MTAPILQLPVKVLRSATAGRRPGDGTFRALTDGEVFVNTQDRVACMLDASGTLFAWPIDPNVLATLGAAAPLMAGTAAAGSANTASRSDHVHPTDTSRAPLASPAFTGTPTAPTPGTGDSSTKLATTGFVLANFGTAAPTTAGTASTGSATTAARSDHVHPVDTSRAKASANSDLTSLSGLTTALSIAQGGTGAATVAAALANLLGAPLASPAFTGSPTAPTRAAGDNSTGIATTAFVYGTVSKAQNGYMKLPNGLIIQWGYAGGTTNGYQGTSLNVSFPTAVCMVTGVSSYNPSSNTAQAVVVSVFNPTTTGFNWSSRYYNGGFQTDNNSLYWIAVGY